MVDATDRTKFENPNLTASDWDLFVGDPKMDKHCDRAAVRINERLTEAVRAGWDRETVYTAVFDTMVQFSATGATDTEPRAVLNGLLDGVFGRDDA